MLNLSTRKISFTVALIIISTCCQSQIKGFSKIKWERERPARGLTWKHTHTVIKDTIVQNINILVVNLNLRRTSILYNPKENVRTSVQASAAGAIASVNAGFFNVKDGGSVTYIRTNGIIADADTAKRWPKNKNMTGTILIDFRGHLTVTEAMTNGWYDAHPEFQYVLVTGPLLLHDKSRVNLPETSLASTTHPRTSLGVIRKNKIVLVTVDGRTSEATGMPLAALTDLMLSLRCRDAVNLDGGGSTTMWIKGKPFGGVVNMPCDNKKFDHEGERAVSDILIIK